MKNLLFVISFVFTFSTSFSQNTVGLLSFDSELTQEGLNFLYPHNQGNVYLMDNCGRIVHVWEDTLFTPGVMAYLHTDGLMYKTFSRGGLSNEVIHAGGAGEGIEIRNFDDEVLWHWTYNDSTKRMHHDIAVMENGNILAIAWERKVLDEMLQAGRNPDSTNVDEVWPDHIIEIQPIYPDSASIVWEWHAWDHLVQDFDEGLDNFGVVADHPELMDINYISNPDTPNWTHINAINYNEVLDQIIVSSPFINEMWIIDHSTTTAQAATHSGGLSGQGGDLIFRWGNPAVYQAGTSDDQRTFFQHDTHWLDIELDTSDPDFGKIGFFNNRVGEDYSSVGIIDPTFDSYELGYEMEDGQFLPHEIEWEYHRPDSTAMYSNIVSSLQKLPNGNSLICVGRPGYAFEITEDEEVVWEYKVPLLAGEAVSQGTELSPSDNILFRMVRYSFDYPGLDGQTFEPIGYIELDPNLELSCPLDSIISVNELTELDLLLYPNPTNDQICVALNQEWGTIKSLRILDLNGSVVLENLPNNKEYLICEDISFLAKGTYILQLRTQNDQVVYRKVVRM